MLRAADSLRRPCIRCWSNTRGAVIPELSEGLIYLLLLLFGTAVVERQTHQAALCPDARRRRGRRWLAHCCPKRGLLLLVRVLVLVLQLLLLLLHVLLRIHLLLHHLHLLLQHRLLLLLLLLLHGHSPAGSVLPAQQGRPGFNTQRGCDLLRGTKRHW